MSRLMSCVWYAQISAAHKDRAAAIAAGVCSVPWRHQPALHVVMMEFAGTVLLTILPRLVITNNYLTNNDSNKLARGAIVGFIVLGVVVFGMNISGSMFNPTLAALLVGGCEGHSPLQHLAFYWIIPIIGAVFGNFLYNQLEQSAITTKKSQKESKKLK